MKKASKLALAALALSLVPFKLKRGKDGEFSYQSVLFGFSRSNVEGGKQNLTFSLFNLPDFLKKKTAAAPSDSQTEEQSGTDDKASASEISDAAPESPEASAEPTA